MKKNSQFHITFNFFFFFSTPWLMRHGAISLYISNYFNLFHIFILFLLLNYKFIESTTILLISLALEIRGRVPCTVEAACSCPDNTAHWRVEESG